MLKVIHWIPRTSFLSFMENFAVQSLSHARLFATPWTTSCQASLSFTISRSLLTLMSIESVMPSNHLIRCCPLLLLPSIFPSMRVFSNESALCIRWGFGASASVLEYSRLISFWMTDLISLASKGLWRVFSKATVQKYQFFSAQSSLWSSSENHTWL